MHRKRTPVRCLLNDVADVNVISQITALQCNLVRIDVPISTIEGFRGKKGYYYGTYKLCLQIVDSIGVERIIEDVFFAIDLSSSDVLLGQL